MVKPLEHNVETEDVFRVKVSNFHLIDVDLRREVLWQYKFFLELLLDGLDMTRQKVQDEPSIPPEERPYILKATEHDWVSYDARLKWVEQQLRDLS